MEAPVKKISLISLTIPILVEQVLRNLMGTVNVYMLGNVSDNAVASVGVANQILGIFVIAFMTIGAGAAVLINYEIGALRYGEAAKISMNAVTVGFIIGLISGIIIVFFAPFFVGLIGLEAQLVPDTVNYLKINGAISVLLAVSYVYSNIFRCYGSAKVPMFIVIFNNIINIAGSYVVIFRPFETPLAGVAGVAFIRAFSETAGFAVQSVLLSLSKLGFKLIDLVKLQTHYIKRIFNLGFMTGLEGISYTIAQVATTSYLTAFGAAALSAKVYTQSIDYFGYIVGLSIGQAAQVISAQMIGAGNSDGAFRFIKRNWRYIVSFNIAISVAMYLFANPILRVFTSDPVIIGISRQLFLINIFIQIGRSFNHTYNFGLRSASYIIRPMFFSVSFICFFNIGVSYVFSITLGLGIIGVWLATLADEWVRGLILMRLWFTRKWLKTIPKPPERT